MFKLTKSLFVFVFMLLFQSAVAQCSASAVPPDTINGIYISESYTGSVLRFPTAFSVCGGTVSTPNGSLQLGGSGAFSYTMNFSRPIKDLTIAITATGALTNENFIFTTDNGIPSISAVTSCYSTINGNEILSGFQSQPPGGGGVFVISSTSNFTSMTITGSGGQSGSLLAVCASSIAPDTSSYFTQNVSICEGDSFLYNNNAYRLAGSYADTLVNAVGLDSVVTTNLTINASYRDTSSALICFGDSVNGHSLPGFYSDTFVNNLGCDSILILQLDVLAQKQSSQNIRLCQGDTFYVGTSKYTAAGTYTDTVLGTMSCDSIITTTLSVVQHSAYRLDTILCENERVQVAGKDYASSGTFYDTIPNLAGCDSFITVNVLIQNIQRRNQIVNLCEGDTLFVGSSFYLSGGTYIDTFVSATGCDSIVTSDLREAQSSSSQETYVLCEGESVLVNGVSEHVPGTYSDTLSTVFGCDSIISITLLEQLDPLRCIDTVLIPSAFSPNDDRLNDNFRVLGGGIAEINLKVYNRWGELLFETIDPDGSWDGTFKNEVCQNDVYMYTAIILFENKSRKRYSGTLSLVR